MKLSLIKKIFLGTACSAVAITGMATYYSADFDRITTAKLTTSYVTEDKEVQVEIFHRQSGDTLGHPMFVVGDTINKAINYKKQNLTEDVQVDFSIYRVNYNVACYYKPNTLNYGEMTRLDTSYTNDCERITYSMIKAAKYGVKVNFLFHRCDGKTLPYMQPFLDDPCYHDASKQVKDYLTIRKVEWPLDNMGTYQMHSKQLLVNKYLDHDGTVRENGVWSSSANVDEHAAFSNLPISYKDWTNSGLLISGNEKLYDVSKRFFDLTFENYKDRDVFFEETQKLKNDGLLSYSDEKLDMFFTPLDHTYSDAWDLEDNPVAKYMERLKTCTGQIKFFANMYNFSASDAYSKRIVTTAYEAFSNNTNEGNELGITMDRSWTKEDEYYKLITSIGGDVKLDRKTHSKDYIFYFGDTDEYVVITGTANAHLGEMFWKSNQVYVFKEQGEKHPIYDEYVKIFEHTLADKSAVDKMG